MHKNTRARQIYKLARQTVEASPEIPEVPTPALSSGNLRGHETTRREESPLPADANENEINELMCIFNEEKSSNCSPHSEPEDHTYNNENKPTTNVTRNQSFDRETNHSSHESSNNNEKLHLTLRDNFTGGDKSDDEGTRNIETPHPSPDCEINHADFDCDNHFCAWFVGSSQTMCEYGPSPQSDLFSTNTDVLSTPHGNSPLSTHTTPTSRTRNYSSRKDKGNVRRRHVHAWIDTKRKTGRNLGLEYTSRNGTVRQAKQMKGGCSNTCRTKCSEKFSENERTRVFKKFWSLGDRSKQWQFIANLVIKRPKRRVLTDTISKRNFTISYQLPKNNNGTKDLVVVCKTMFLNTLAVSDQFVFTALEKLDKETGLVTPDGRGKHGNHSKVVTQDLKTSVCDHILSIKPVESHYVRQRSEKLYLDGDLTFRKLFALYNEWFDSGKYTDKAKTERQYRDIVNENFKLSFHVKKKDQCDQCHIYKNVEIPSNEQRSQYEKHVNNKKIARELKSKDKSDARKSNGKIAVATFDFQKVLNAPHGNLSIFYYKRKLSVFNFTVYEVGTKEGTCYMWHEGDGRRGANEVTSCLLHFIKKRSATGTKEFRFWSDNCVGQNRNRIVYAMYAYAANEYNVSIKHTFLEKGHTQNEGDSVHALIERTAKNKEVFCPDEWYCLVRWAKQDGKPYNVIEMKHTDMLNTKALLDGRNWSKNINGQKINWNKIREISVSSNDAFKIHYKYDLAEENSIIVLRNNTRNFQRDVLKELYPRPLTVPKAKKDDLTGMCKNGIIPQRYHDFFNQLADDTSETTHASESDEVAVAETDIHHESDRVPKCRNQSRVRLSRTTASEGTRPIRGSSIAVSSVSTAPPQPRRKR